MNLYRIGIRNRKIKTELKRLRGIVPYFKPNHARYRSITDEINQLVSELKINTEIILIELKKRK